MLSMGNMVDNELFFDSKAIPFKQDTYWHSVQSVRDNIKDKLYSFVGEHYAQNQPDMIGLYNRFIYAIVKQMFFPYNSHFYKEVQRCCKLIVKNLTHKKFSNMEVLPTSKPLASTVLQAKQEASKYKLNADNWN